MLLPETNELGIYATAYVRAAATMVGDGGVRRCHRDAALLSAIEEEKHRPGEAWPSLAMIGFQLGERAGMDRRLYYMVEAVYAPAPYRPSPLPFRPLLLGGCAFPR